jgi:multidrug efflux pump
MVDLSATIRASIHDIEWTMVASIVLVVLVVFLFLRNFGATMIPGVVVPLSLIGTFGIMYLLGFSINNLSIMALTISTGFVVDDAIVVIENITRYLEQGLPPFRAALRGASEIGFTVVSISASLVAVFIPILLMGGIVGRLFREFAVTLTVAILISMVISLTGTPMMCAHLLRQQRAHGRMYRASEKVFTGLVNFYGRTLTAVLRHPAITMAVFLLTVALNIYLFTLVPKGFFPQQDNGRMMGSIMADQDTSFQAMNRILLQMIDIIKADPAVENVIGFTGGGGGGLGGAAQALPQRVGPAAGAQPIL